MRNNFYIISRYFQSYVNFSKLMLISNALRLTSHRFGLAYNDRYVKKKNARENKRFLSH